MKSLYVIFFKLKNGGEVYYTGYTPSKNEAYLIGTTDIYKATTYKDLNTAKVIVECKKKLVAHYNENGADWRYGEELQSVVSVGVREVKLELGNVVSEFMAI